MTYTVTWLRVEEDRLLEFWLQAADRAAMTAASHKIERHLRHHPRAQADEYDGFYELQEAPLAVAYQVSDADRLVTIIGVRLLDPNG